MQSSVVRHERKSSMAARDTKRTCMPGLVDEEILMRNTCKPRELCVAHGIPVSGLPARFGISETLLTPHKQPSLVSGSRDDV